MVERPGFSKWTNLTFRAREFCINSIEEYEEKVKEIEELKKAQAQEEEAAEEDVEENAEENEEVPEGEEQKEGKAEKLEGEPEEKKPKTSSSNASTLSIELKEKKSLRKVFILLLRVTWPSFTSSHDLLSSRKLKKWYSNAENRM